MNKKLKAKWIKTLLSGEYVQGKEYLRRRAGGSTPTKYCCLGVLCEVAGLEFKRGTDYCGRAAYGYILPNGTFVANNEVEAIGIAFGFGREVALDLANKNDRGTTFGELVRTIRAAV